MDTNTVGHPSARMRGTGVSGCQRWRGGESRVGSTVTLLGHAPSFGPAPATTCILRGCRRRWSLVVGAADGGVGVSALVRKLALAKRSEVKAVRDQLTGSVLGCPRSNARVSQLSRCPSRTAAGRRLLLGVGVCESNSGCLTFRCNRRRLRGVLVRTSCRHSGDGEPQYRSYVPQRCSD